MKSIFFWTRLFFARIWCNHRRVTYIHITHEAVPHPLLIIPVCGICMKFHDGRLWQDSRYLSDIFNQLVKNGCDIKTGESI